MANRTYDAADARRTSGRAAGLTLPSNTCSVSEERPYTDLRGGRGKSTFGSGRPDGRVGSSLQRDSDGQCRSLVVGQTTLTRRRLPGCSGFLALCPPGRPCLPPTELPGP